MTKNTSSQGKHQAATVLQAGEEDTLQVPTPDTAPDAGPQSLADMQKIADSAAKHRPVQFSQRNEAMEPLNKPQTINMPATGNLSSMQRSDLVLEPVDALGFENQAAQLAFNNEMVIVNIAEANDPSAENPVMLSINGRAVYIKRGEDTVVRRMYVEQLLRAKPIGITTKVGRDDNGEVTNKITKTSAMKYPFSLVRDDNTLGRAWMRKILSEA